MYDRYSDPILCVFDTTPPSGISYVEHMLAIKVRLREIADLGGKLFLAGHLACALAERCLDHQIILDSQDCIEMPLQIGDIAGLPFYLSAQAPMTQIQMLDELDGPPKAILQLVGNSLGDETLLDQLSRIRIT